MAGDTRIEEKVIAITNDSHHSDATESNIEHDSGTSYGGDKNYNNHLKVIKYEKT